MVRPSRRSASASGGHPHRVEVGVADRPGGRGVGRQPAQRPFELAAPEQQLSKRARHPWHEHFWASVFDDVEEALEQLQPAVDVTTYALEQRQLAACRADAVVVAERFGHVRRLGRQLTRQDQLAGVQGAVGLKREHGRGNAAVAASDQATGGGAEELLGLVVAITEMDDDALQRPRRIDAELIAGPLGGASRLLDELPSGVEVVVERSDGDQCQAAAAQAVVCEFGRDLMAEAHRADVVRGDGVSEHPEAGQQSRLEQGALVGRPIDRPPQDLDALPGATMQVPQPRRRRREAAPSVGVFGGETPVEGGTEVVTLRLDGGAPRVLVPVELRFGGFGDGEEVIEVTVPRRAHLAGLGEPFERVLTDRLQQPESCGVVALVGDHE